MEHSDIYDIFDEGGQLSQKMESYEFREGQLEMALLINRAFKEHSICAIEAGTGIGKSFAYLAIALLWAKERTKERTVIATNTINLQKQLYEKDLSFLKQVMNSDIKGALLMGRANYLCLRRLEQVVKEITDNPQLQKLLKWAQKSKSGLKSDFKGKLDEQLWFSVNSDADSCYGYKCPYHSQCFYYKSRKEASEANIIITNHHLLFTDISYREKEELDFDSEGVLPSFSNLIIDEAHNIEKNATDFFNYSYDKHSLTRSVDRCTKKRFSKNAPLEDLKQLFIQDKSYKTVGTLFSEIQSTSLDIETYLLSLFDKTSSNTLLLNEENKTHLNPLLPFADQLNKNSETLLMIVQRILEKASIDEELESRGRELLTHIKNIYQLSLNLNLFLSWEESEKLIRWMELKKEKTVTVNTTTLSVATLLKDLLFSQLNSVVCTSATLDLNDDFNYWGSRVGLPLGNRPFLKAVYPSPFNFKENLLLLTPFDAPLFNEKENSRYVEYCITTIKEALISSGGGALVLFTSYSMLNLVFNELKEILAKEKIEIMKQEDEDRFQLLQRFKEEQDSVLFATDSFWEGVDAPGSTLRMVVITKLPFRLPTDPVFKARMEALDKEGLGGFFNLALPEATMRLKQGFGRLLRNNNDKGIVLILDGRIVNKQYGYFMLNSLPPSFHPETESNRINEKIEDFLYTLK
ncbi:MAG: helicase C-terminal domain-containing protein [Sphaerochaetaceae bacterium]